VAAGENGAAALRCSSVEGGWPGAARGRGVAEDGVSAGGQPWGSGATVSSSSPAFGWQWRWRSEASEWRRKERTRALALRGTCSAHARAKTRTGLLIWACHVTARWRPSGGGARVVSAGEARKGGEQRWGRQRATRGHVQELEVELGVLHRR
jgi:hypothetical protein